MFSLLILNAVILRVVTEIILILLPQELILIRFFAPQQIGSNLVFPHVVEAIGRVISGSALHLDIILLCK